MNRFYDLDKQQPTQKWISLNCFLIQKNVVMIVIMFTILSTSATLNFQVQGNETLSKIFICNLQNQSKDYVNRLVKCRMYNQK